MDLLKNKKLNHLVSELNRKKPYLAESINLKLQMALTVPAVLLAKQIKEYAPEVLDKEEVTVIVAGAAFNEIMNKCRSYYLLNTLLNTNIKWNIFLIGNETAAEQPPHYYNITKHYKDEPVSIELSTAMLGPALDMFGMPDVLELNHPGLESHYESWFIEDDGIDRCLKAGVPIVGCSYGTDEIEIDRFYAEAFGLTLKHSINNLYFDMSEKPSQNMIVPKEIEAAARSGMMDWGRTIWGIEPSIQGVDHNEDRLGEIRDIDAVRSSVNQYLLLGGIIESPYECYGQYLRWEDGRRILRVFGNYSLDMTNGVIFDEDTCQIMNEDAELDTSDVNMNNLSIHDTLLLMSQVYKNYIADNLAESEVLDEADDDLSLEDLFVSESMHEMFGDPNMIKSLMGDNFDPNLEGLSMNDLFGFKEKNELSEVEERIAESAYNGDVKALGAFASNDLKDFTDESHKNLIHIAAANDDVTLLKFALEQGVSLSSFDGDSYSVLDICCESPVSLTTLKYLLDEGLVNDLINRQDPRGFTAIYRAADSGSKEAYDLLLSHGADASIAAVSGNSAEGLANYVFNQNNR